MKQKKNIENKIIVMKFGGTSLRNKESRSNAIKHISRHYEFGKKIIVVVSAMGRKGEPYATDTLISLMKNIGEPVNPAELDSVISIGETLSATLFSHFLNQNNLPAESFSGSKTGSLTNNTPGNAEILEIDPARLLITLNQGKIAVVAGFQGTNSEGEVRTLGRGGSDTSAVALGSAILALIMFVIRPMVKKLSSKPADLDLLMGMPATIGELEGEELEIPTERESGIPPRDKILEIAKQDPLKTSALIHTWLRERT